MDPDETPKTRLKRTSRLLSAWQALMGAPTAPASMRAEWVAWQYEFEAILDKITAAVNRQYTRDKIELKKALKRIEELEQNDPQGDPVELVASAYQGGGWNPAKRLLNRRVLAMKGIKLPDTFEQEQNHVDGDQSSDVAN